MKSVVSTITTLIVAVGLAFSPVNAEDSNTTDVYTKYCLTISNLATAVMKGRQNGVPMAKMIAVAKSDKIARALVMDAYSAPVASTQAEKEMTIRTFADTALLVCLKAVDKQ